MPPVAATTAVTTPGIHSCVVNQISRQIILLLLLHVLMSY